MLKLEVVRPNTVGTTYTAEYATYADAEDWIERKVERLCDKGWQASEIKGSNSQAGAIELTHDNEADVIVIQWSMEL
jgi:hypothetical protein